MKNIYNSEKIENFWYKNWINNKIFEKINKKKPYCIMLPPPNITGSLHMGHAFQNTIIDILIRYNIMKKRNTLWQGGTDHAGIATQIIVENNLSKKNINKNTIGRKKFINITWEWKKKSSKNIINQLKVLGCFINWKKECFTMDKKISHAVQTTFIKLYKEQYIYKGKKLVNWDPILKTAISDLEVISKKEQSFLWYIKYKIYDSNNFIIIPTTRPETIFGDTAIAINPKDNRYKNLINKKIISPITNRIIPIIEDEYVDINFGTGCLKITPAHDFNDYKIGKKHSLKIINIFTNDAKLNINVPKNYRNLERIDARNKIIKELQELNLIYKKETYIINIPRSDRTNAIIEPFITDQWYIKMKKLSEEAIISVKKKSTKFIPTQWKKIYFNWMNKIEDWCISRQLWWGHRIPAWYSNKEIYIGYNKKYIEKIYKIKNQILTQDPDVLDTWFSSALWPFSTLGWPNKNKEYYTFFPTNILITGFDIIFFWVARMIIFSLKFTKKIPFKKIYIHGLIKYTDGQKMSKSKGNVIDPIDIIKGIDLKKLIYKRCDNLLNDNIKTKITNTTIKEFSNGIESHGTDALRFYFCNIATSKKYINFDIKLIKKYKNFCNKLWNATIFISNNKKNLIENNNTIINNINVFDSWILSIWQNIKYEIIKNIKNYKFDLLAQKLYEFIWNQFCDWYLEFIKQIINNYNNKQINNTKNILLNIYKEIIITIHPIMPYISEEIWQIINNKKSNLINIKYVIKKNIYINKKIENEIKIIKNFILYIRNLKNETNINIIKKINIYIKKNKNKNYNIIKKYIYNIQILEKINFIKKHIKKYKFIILINNKIELYMYIYNIMNIKNEITYINKNLIKYNIKYKQIIKKLNNKTFLLKAPKNIINLKNNKLKKIKILNKKLEKKIKILS